ncbi:proto-oncogene tyrosine-protein kinase receptor Ret isoform X1 [Cotesia glomerata]|uniref:proto-oncogene tyrosine-protein kinase receptor Ret isoform X1 n=1 Tax=Cotesia glomerata TaxID=32391 RepID=UPI001D001A81|nr:proto-oncogene tyrosine-protein kinase receptor Ret isoform X1 [Cotesia glomerata]XP_044595520.1 proto-oncogene tyrosine-protein kinase receptor Ret isoform X1 [Cotesia glomerata]
METEKGRKKVRTQVVLLFLLLTLFTTFGSALYFPQSDLTLRLPYLLENDESLKTELTLLNLRTLPNDSITSRNPKYQIVSESDKYVRLVTEKGQVIYNLRSLTQTDTSRTIVIQAQEEKDKATMEIKILPVKEIGGKLNCTEFTKDMCFWNVSKYRIYENQLATMLGKISSPAFKTLCPTYHVIQYELLNGTEYFQIINESFYSKPLLDRDTVDYPGGPGAHVEVQVKCIVRNEQSGAEYTHETNLDIDILDLDDNPPIAQISNNVEITLRDFTANTRLDENDLMVKDADSNASNTYTVKILGDVHNALYITYDAISVDYTNPEIPPTTAIYTRVFSRTTLLPKSPYKVILQVTDESLIPGRGEKSVNITLSFIGPQHHLTSTTTATPPKKPISFPTSVTISRLSLQFFRVTQPSFKPPTKFNFSILDSKIFNVTPKGGIIYVANTSLLQTAPFKIPLTIQWSTPGHKLFTASLTLYILNPSTILVNNSCINQTTALHSCANAMARKSCESQCGIGGGSFSNSTTSECIWRSNNPANSAIMTERYETCTADLVHCPDNICDELEHLDPRICPQDCTIESEVHFAEMNRGGRGIKSGLGTCSCNDMMQCTCGPVHFRKTGSDGSGATGAYGSANKEVARIKKERQKETAISDAHKVASTNVCGPGCLIGAAGASFFVLLVVGAFVMWRYRTIGKNSRRECKHRSDDMNNGLGILPLDYLDRGDGHLISIDSFAATNRSLLLPKSSPPDPKWEFSRSRLTIEQVLGEGEFGRVLRAKAVDIGGWPGPTTVAVKTLKEDASGSELADLLSEYQLLKEAQHPNVIRLLGACTSPGGPVYLIIEFAEFGSLRNYLRRSRHLESEGRVPCSTSLLSASPGNTREELQDTSLNYTITPHDILSFAWQISKGMAYLADIKLVHRDLAARNVLLATGKVCKISDFGLTRDVYEDDAYLKRSKGRVPVKWMAPESLADHVYTSKSDVWSFGVLLWELVTLGASPYPGVDVHNLYNLLKAGYRMERPANCSAQLYKLMVSCWHDEPGMRPSFKELTCQWERMLEDGVEYLDLNPRTVHNQAYFASLHALDSPTSSSNEGVISGNFSTFRTEAVNYLSKPSAEPITKCDKIDKLQALWQDPICSFPVEPVKTTYVNERPDNLNVNHYESPIKLRRVSVTSNCENNLKTPTNERPQSYIDMQGKKSDNDNNQNNLLLFNNVNLNNDKINITNDFTK